MTNDKTETWIGKKVLVFRHEEYSGFLPHFQGIVLAETKEECLVKQSWGYSHWVFKESKNIKPAFAVSGFAKPIIAELGK